MTHLLDAHTLIWSQDCFARLGAAAVDVLTDRTNQLAVGVGTLWEIAIKVALGKLARSKSLRQWIDTAVGNLELEILPISLDHVEGLGALPNVENHKDPFDRLLVAQALVQSIAILSNDTKLDAYGVTRIWD